jgi:mannosyl-3-phosphoglycerate phosphatase family protein
VTAARDFKGQCEEGRAARRGDGNDCRPSKLVIFSDLDGTLLDHYDYSHAAADALLAELEGKGIPLVLASSKTFAELLPLRDELANRHPFIVENGAAVYIPRGYFREQPPGSSAAGVYWRRSFSAPHDHWLALVHSKANDFAFQFTALSDMEAARIASLTGLDAAAAANAARREFGEPLLWHGSDGERQRFIDTMHKNGAQVLQGGRFLHVGGECDKGRALRWLRRLYAMECGGTAPLCVAIGDGDNDAAMLEAAEYAVIVRSPSHPPPRLSRRERVKITSACGPAGWDEGLRRLLSALR